MSSVLSTCHSAEVNSPEIILKGDRLIAFGDSMTRGYGVPEGDGWVEIVTRTIDARLGRSVAVVNAGGNGNTSREGLQRFDADVRPLLPATVFIEFGGNDPVNDAARHVTPEEFQNNLKAIVAKVREAGGECVILTFPVVISSIHATSTDPVITSGGGLDAVIVPYRDLARRYAVQEGIPILDLDMLSRGWIAQFGQTAIIAPDGIHWTPEANRLAALSVLELLAGGQSHNPN